DTNSLFIFASMKKILLLCIALTFSIVVHAQHKITLKLVDAESTRPLVGANVSITELEKVSATDERGLVTFVDIPEGRYQFEYRFLGYSIKREHFMFPSMQSHPVIVLLEEVEGEELDVVMVSSTRSSRTIADIPTRVEVIAGEELDEKANMKPGDIRMVLNESTGIQT